MKPLHLFLLSFFGISFFSFSQTGPGGVDNSNSNILWLDASTINAIDNTPINVWGDRSGNNNDAQANSSSAPLIRNNQINGFSSLQFDGIDDYYSFNDNITTGEITIFAVYNSSKINQGIFLQTEKHIYFTENNRITAFYKNPNTRYKIYKGNGMYSIVGIQTDSSTTNAPLFLSNGSTVYNFSRTGFSSNPNSQIGKYGSSLFFQGSIAEIVIFDEVLNSAKRKIVSSYLAAKYDLIAEEDLYSFKTSYNHGVKGIGQEVDGSNLYSRGQDSLAISNASSMDNGDYVLVGHNNAGYSTTTAAGSRAIERWNQVWKVDVTGDPGTVDLEFFLGGNGFAMEANYILLMETVDGDFTNGGTSTHEFGRLYDPINNSIKFTNVNLVDGIHFTLAEKDAPATSMADGFWDDQGIWSCECVPGEDDIVINQHNVTLRNNQSVLDLSIASGGSLVFSGSDTMFVHGDLSVEGSINAGTGTIAAINSSTNQHFYNYSASSIDFHNLYVNNAAGLILGDGGWTVSSSLQVSNGGLDVTLADSLVLISTSSSTAQILPSMDTAFIGTFTIQRYIETRNAGWSDFSSPVANATIADLDDDLYLSGVNGDDGNATYGSSVFYSMFGYDNRNDVHIPMTSTSTALVPTFGYEVWLADNSSSFFGKGIDYKGVPNSGNHSAKIYQGWNFIGNPYQSFISFDSIIRDPWIPNSFYIWNTDNGSYDYFNGSGKPPIAPGQGFWVNKISGGTKLMTFTESTKVSSNSSSFLRQKRKERFSLTISSSVVPYQHKMQVDFSANSSSAIDGNDAYYLKSKLEEAPAITTIATDSEKELIYNSLNSLESSQSIPVSVYAGIPGEYTISAENLDALNEHYSCVFLMDKLNNASIDLRSQPTYTFETNKGKSDRFNLIISNSYQECRKMIEKGTVQAINSKLALRKENDQWYLDYDLPDDADIMEIRIFNMSGQEVKAAQAFEASGVGTHALKNLQSLKGIYLIQVRSNAELLNKTIVL